MSLTKLLRHDKSLCHCHFFFNAPQRSGIIFQLASVYNSDLACIKLLQAFDTTKVADLILQGSETHLPGSTAGVSGQLQKFYLPKA